MKHFILALLLIVPAGCTPVSAVADAAGRWTVTQDRDFKGNLGVPIECTVNQQHTDFAIRCGTGMEMKGRIVGRHVTFGIQRTGIPPMVEDRLVLAYRGEIGESGTTMRGDWRLTSSVLDLKGTFEAEKKP